MRKSLGGQLVQPSAPLRRNVIVFPSASHAAATFPVPGDFPTTGIETPSLTGNGQSEERIRLENCWLDLTSDIASFMELDQEAEMGKADAEELPLVSSPMSSPGLILPDLEMDLKDGVEDDCSTILMNSNLKILEDFIVESNRDSTDDSLDSFGPDLDTNQSLIDEVESFLLAASGGEPTIVAAAGDVNDVPEIDFKGILRAPCSVEARHEETKSATTIAEKNSNILKALVEGKVLTAAAMDDSACDIGLDLTEEDLSNAYTTTVKTETGQDVIIIITQPGGGVGGRSPPSPPSPRELDALSPYSRSTMGSPDYSSSDYEWSPSPASQPAGQPERKKYQRKNRPTMVLEPYPRYR
jgi:hypothetical protein